MWSCKLRIAGVFAENAITLFKAFVIFKAERLKNDLKDGKINQSQYDKKMELYNNQGVLNNLPLPSPKGKLNKDSQ